MNFRFILSFFLLYIINTNAQECISSLKGDVIDFHDRTSLKGAEISILDNGIVLHTTSSDSDGKFIINLLCNGNFELEISHTDCQSKVIPIVIDGDSSIKVTLEHHIEELEEVTITGASNSIVPKTVNVETLELAQIEKYSNASLGDALKEISGVSSLNTGSTIVKPVIQGLNSSRILVITNGVRLQDQEWGIEHAPNVDLNSAETLTVIKGSGALQYGGDAIGGVVLAQPKRLANKDTIYGKTLLAGASNGRGGALTTTINKGFNNGIGLRVQGTYKRFGDFRAPDYFLTNTGTEQIATSIALGINKFNYGAEIYYSYFDTEIGILRAADFGNITDLVRAINSPIPAFTDDFSYTINPPRQEVLHHLIKLKSFFRFEGLGKLSLQYAYQFNDRQEFDNRRGDRDDIPTVDLELSTHTLDINLILDSFSDFKITSGFSGVYQENFADPLTGVRRVIPDYDKFSLGLYGGLSYQASAAVLLDIGGRIDYTEIDALKFYRTSFFESRNYDVDFADIVIEDFGTQLLTNPVFDYTTISATFGLNWELNENLNFLFNYGLASRPPNPSELFSEGLNQSSASFELGDLRIDTEVSNKISTSLTGNYFDQKLNFTISPYANFISDFIVLEPTDVLATSRGTFQVFEYLQNNARLIGIDIDAEFQFNEQWKYTSSFSYLKGDDTVRDEPIINIPPANWFNGISYTNSKWNNFDISLRNELFFRQNRFPNTNFIAQVVENNAFVDVLVDVSTPPPSYSLLHLNSSMNFKNLEIGFGIDNILNTRYRQYLNRFRFFADDLGRNFNINLKINY